MYAIRKLRTSKNIVRFLKNMKWVNETIQKNMRKAYVMRKANGNDNLDYRPIFSEVWWGDFSFFIIHYFSFSVNKGGTQSWIKNITTVYSF